MLKVKEEKPIKEKLISIENTDQFFLNVQQVLLPKHLKLIFMHFLHSQKQSTGNSFYNLYKGLLNVINVVISIITTYILL